MKIVLDTKSIKVVNDKYIMNENEVMYSLEEFEQLFTVQNAMKGISTLSDLEIKDLQQGKNLTIHFFLLKNNNRTY